MENKKTKLTLSGIAKKSIENIELAKTQSKNSVVIEKKQNKFSGKSNFGKNSRIFGGFCFIKNRSRRTNYVSKKYSL